MKSVAPSLILAAALLTGAPAKAGGWWPFETVYVWTRSDGDIFQLRFNMDAENQIALQEEFTPSPHSTAVVPVRAWFIRNYFRKCDFFDARNFLCPSYAPEEYVEMHDGMLTHHYWTEVRA